MKIIRIEKCGDCNFNTVLYDDYYKTSGYTYCLKASKDIYIDKIPDWCPLEDAPSTMPKIDSDTCPNCEQPLMCGQDGLPFCFGCGYSNAQPEER